MTGEEIPDQNLPDTWEIDGNTGQTVRLPFPATY